MIRYCSLHHGPPDYPDGLYELWNGRLACMACIVEQEAQVERWWPELQRAGPTYDRRPPMSLSEILHRLGLEP